MKLENPSIGVVDSLRTPAIIQSGETGAATARTCELWRHHVASRRLQFPASSQTIGAIKATSDHRTAFYAKPARLASSSIEPGSSGFTHVTVLPDCCRPGRSPEWNCAFATISLFLVCSL